MYNNRCLVDTVQISFESLNKSFLDSKMVIPIQFVMISLLCIILTIAVVHWYRYSQSVYLPLSILIFYIMKLFSDSSLTVSESQNLIWKEFNIFGLHITHRLLYSANVDVSIGLIIICIPYFLGFSKLIR